MAAERILLADMHTDLLQAEVEALDDSLPHRLVERTHLDGSHCRTADALAVGRMQLEMVPDHTHTEAAHSDAVDIDLDDHIELHLEALDIVFDALGTVADAAVGCIRHTGQPGHEEGSAEMHHREQAKSNAERCSIQERQYFEDVEGSEDPAAGTWLAFDIVVKVRRRADWYLAASLMDESSQTDLDLQDHKLDSQQADLGMASC